MKYKIPVTWSVEIEMTIEADSLAEAIEEADNLPLPENAEYIDGRFEINRYIIPYINKLTEAEKKEISAEYV